MPNGNPMEALSMMGGAGPAPGPTQAMSEMALGAMDQLSPKSPNPGEALDRISTALDVAHRVIQSILPQVSEWSPKMGKDLHNIGRAIMSAKADLLKEPPIMPPPPMVSGGLGSAGAGGYGGAQGFGPLA